MDNATRTTEGLPSRCPVCGKRMSITPGDPLGDVICPHCGVLFYAEVQQTLHVPDDLRRLAELGAIVETDAEGEVMHVKFNGPQYDDQSIIHLSKLQGISTIDVRNTSITADGADRLRALLPDAIVVH